MHEINSARFVSFPRMASDLTSGEIDSFEHLYEIVKLIELSKIDFDNFCGDMTVERDYIEKNAVLCSTGEVWKCLFIRERGQQAGILVVPVDACFVKHAAYVIG